jgi:hypothetical protein
MATIYNANGEQLTTGLQSRKVCDEAMRTARQLADQIGEPVYLEDGDWRNKVWPDGSFTDEALDTTALDVIADFLRLPSTALPSAICLDELARQTNCDAWSGLRHPSDWCNGPILLTADHDGWRGGIIVDIKAATVQHA